MGFVTLDRGKLEHNFNYLDDLFRRCGKEWAVVAKLLCGNELYLRELVRLHPKQLCDARIGNLKAIKEIDPETETVYIRPAPLRSVPAVVRYADISFNTQLQTLQALSEEAVKQGVMHKVVIMVEMGERREGVMRSYILDFYARVRELPNIRIVGLGANFACLSGVLPSRGKLSRLVVYRDLITRRFGDVLPIISGGSSVTVALLRGRRVPEQVNHFRIGETLFFGTDVYRNMPMPGMCQDVLKLHAQIIELKRKPVNPDGKLGVNLEGNMPGFDPGDEGRVVWRAIADVGLLDVESCHLMPDDPSVECVGASSDMLVVNLGKNPGGYCTGDYITFNLNYMAALRLMNSDYVEKRVIGSKR